jgi:hypothetical protein
MEKAIAVFPVRAGKDARDVIRVVEARRDQHTAARRRMGVHMERGFEQVTPMGTFMVAYVESDRPFGDTAAEVSKSELEAELELAAAMNEITGFDASTPGEPSELLADWVDDTVTERKPGLAFFAPIRPGAAEAGRRFAREAYVVRRHELAASRRQLGITRETVTLNHIPTGDVVCVYLEGDDPVDSNRRFAESRSEYDVWFKDRAASVFLPEIDFNQPISHITPISDEQYDLET